MIKIDCKKTLSLNFSLDVKFEIKDSQFISLYGKSGSGKTTLLRILAGFLITDSGHAKNDKFFYFDDKYFMPPQKRNIGYLFQDMLYFPI